MAPEGVESAMAPQEDSDHGGVDLLSSQPTRRDSFGTELPEAQESLITPTYAQRIKKLAMAIDDAICCDDNAENLDRSLEWPDSHINLSRQILRVRLKSSDS